jgi:hypothetical protein
MRTIEVGLNHRSRDGVIRVQRRHRMMIRMSALPNLSPSLSARRTADIDHAPTSCARFKSVAQLSIFRCCFARMNFNCNDVASLRLRPVVIT